MVQKMYPKMHPVPCTNIHHDITDLVNQGMVKNTRTWISWEWNITFSWNKKISQPMPHMTQFEKLSFFSRGKF